MTSANRFAAAALAATLLGLCAARADVPVPPLAARVTDLTGTLDAGQRAALEARLAEFEQRKGSQLAVLLVPTTQPETIEQYSIRVVEQWRLGRKGVDDGALLLVAKDDRAVRIEVGRGLEGPLPDAIASRIIRERITPRFREGDFYGGIGAGLDRMIGVIDGEPLPAPESASLDGGDIFVLAVVVAVALALGWLAILILRMVLGRLGAAAVAGGGVGLLVWMVSAVVVFAILAAIAIFVFALVVPGGRAGRAGRWTSGGRRGGGWSPSGGGGGFGGGGFGGGGGGFGGGGGGFSGGGGGFSGGGASGRW